MKYRIKFKYKDDEVKELAIREKNLESFFSELSNGQMYKSPETDAGFWTSFDQVKYIEAIPIEEEEKMKWNLETRKIKDLHEYAKNPRTLSKEQGKNLQKSLTKFGQCEPIVINQDGTIVGGHQRLRTLQKMGKKKVDVYVPDTPLTEEEVQELNIRLNHTGSWDWDILANSWNIHDILEWGFTEKYLGLDFESKEKENNEKFTCPTCGKKSKKNFSESTPL